MIELDVRRTGDGELAILHDHDHSGVALDSCPLDEFETRTGFRPPLLAEVLDWAAGRIGLDVELKEDGYTEQLAPLLRASAGRRRAARDLVPRSAAGTLGIAPGLRLGLLVEWTAPGCRASPRGRREHCAPAMRLVKERPIAELPTPGWSDRLGLHGRRPRRPVGDARVAAVITDDVPGALAARAALTD